MSTIAKVCVWAVLTIFTLNLQAGESVSVAIIGTGDMGDSLGPKLAEAGYRIIYGSRDPSRDSVHELVAKTGSHASAATQQTAAQEADIVLLAVPWPPAARMRTVNYISSH